MEQDEEQLIKDAKLTFETPHGIRVLETIKSICRGNTNQALFCEESTQQTSYNLGANFVYRYIQHLVDTDLSEPKTEDCITEIETEKKGI